MKKTLLSAFAVLLLPVPASFAATVTVTQVGLTFSPDSVSIDVGDTVEWVFTGGIHTVTSGFGAADPQSGVLFDSPLTAAVPLFSFTYTSEGEFPYYCTPHEIFNMLGNVTVSAPTPVGEDIRTESWGKVKTEFPDAQADEAEE